MTALWNSPEQLALGLRWITTFGILSTAGFAAAAYFVNERIGVLQDALIVGQGNEIKNQKASLRVKRKPSRNKVEKLRICPMICNPYGHKLPSLR